MKDILKYSCILLFSLCAINVSAQGSKMIPAPLQYEVGEGEFGLKKRVSIGGDGEMKQIAKLFSESLKEKTNGLKPEVALSHKILSSIWLKKNTNLSDEEYKISISEQNVVCEASSTAGMYYAVQTLLQNLEEKNGQYSWATGTIHDKPRYQWRGMMLDFSRHFYDKEVVKNILDVMAHLKMNRFHMHLTDENGWRIEIKQYPKLTEIGAEGNWSDRTAPRQFFTQEDIKEIIAYAGERGIMVIPEIDMPGHATSVSLAYPEISGGGEGRWAGFTFHPAKETTYQFIDNVLSEVADLFPAPYIHIGGDEVHYGNQNWFTDPIIQSFIKENNLGNEVGLEHYFVRRVCDMIHAKGKKMIGWDEILASGVTPDKAVVMWWRHDKPEQLTIALERGFQVVMTPRLPCYFDFVQDESQQIGRRWGKGYNPLPEVYDFPNNVEPLIENYKDQILGLQASVWTERIANTKRLYYMIFPRLAAISEDAWTAKEKKNYELFEENLKPFLKYLDSKGVNYFNPFDKKSTPEPWGPNKQDVIAEG